MRNHHISGMDRFFTAPDGADGRCHGGPHHHHRGRHGGRHGGRLFDHGELRLLVLAMMAEQPRYGYELIKAIEERMGGSYSPSPGVIYPLLSWLEEVGYAAQEAEEGGRKRYRLTPEGEAFVAANRPALESLFARIGGYGSQRAAVPDTVIRAMENLKLALRLRLRQGALEPAAAESIAAALDTAASAVERS
ncbi:PadR family transcriptional regulator [Roseomonas marmotae]|uniref:PadR family transcriptional regulator n=2 Tax=Roseomonas marmotae TaxID=2768161 RepID=A0ABS3KC35_9PROT|nr:PadR family transcriptional regulator [Roseomonas marmotae]QTI80810.1 PadR family transcriptional regulator [Roseomonas marmotae]